MMGMEYGERGGFSATKKRSAPRDGAAGKQDFITRERGLRLLRGGVLCTISWLLTQNTLLFSVNPLALSLLCASEGQVGWIFIGLLLGAWANGGSFVFYAGAGVLALALRLFARLFLTPPRKSDTMDPRRLRRLYLHRRRLQLRQICRHGIYSGGGEKDGREAPDGTSPAEAAVLPSLFDEPIRLRVLASLFAALLPAIAIPARAGFAYYDLYGAIFTLLLCPVATCLYAGFLAPEVRIGGKNADLLRWLGGVSLLLSVSFCGRSLVWLGASPVMILTVFVALLTVTRHGLLFGALVGGVGILPCGVTLMPPVLLIVVFYALAQGVVGTLALLPGLLCSLVVLLMVGGEAMFWAVAPSLVIGVLFFGVYLHRFEKKRQATAGGPVKSYRQDSDRSALLLEQSHATALSARMSAIAGAFSGLSEVFRQLGDSMQHPGATELRYLCDESFDHYCPDCPARDTCWTDDYAQTLECLNRLGRTLSESGSVDESAVSAGLGERCPNMRAILGDINYRFTRRSYEALHGAKSEMFAQSYDAIAQLMRDLQREEREYGEDTADESASEAVAAYLDRRGMNYTHVVVSGRRRRRVQVTGLSPAGMTIPQEELVAELGKCCGARLGGARYNGSGEGCMTFRALPNLQVRYMHRSMAAGENVVVRQSNRTVCGDTVRLFDGMDDRFHALLCDGMGSGRNAAMTSGICAVFIERILRTGVSVDTALRMLNQYLRARTTSPEDECSSTIDLMSVDLFDGKATFVKSGAAETVILRGGQMYRLVSHTVPIGILHAIDAQVIPFDLRAGDRIIMMSDGVSESAGEGAGESEEDSLTRYFSGSVPEDDGILIDELFAGARARGSTDDMSVIALRIEETA